MTDENDTKFFDRADAGLYDYFATGLEGDVAFYVEEAKKAGSPVLELGCGTGRVLIPVAEAGVQIIGLDLAPTMLAIAKQKIAKLSAETQKRIELVQGDMREFSVGRRFNLIMIPYRAFQALLTPRDQRQALACIREHLVYNGLLALNIFDPNLDIITEHASRLGGALLKESEFINPETGHRVIVWNTRRFDREQQMLDQLNIFEEVDNDGMSVSRTHIPLRLRYIFRYEMQYLLEVCGFRIEALYGDFRRGPFRPGVEQIWLARRT